ncbi:response regulator [Desulfobacula phenolica]|uniref:Putative two-component system response regulator n=1 Tax=Desulfobacula phenolica TaxID=90732 RepID=A0A1H2JAC6_9BACT|nr:HD domain-containing phosphohydrolase [Desulfobacula phenolica]SDU53085.1 putative two-component system response regulator [Desulfobacula phenolica]
MNNHLKKQKIMIVDDTPANITVLGKALSENYEICVATNGPDAIKIARNQPYPDLILLDIMMPVMDGYEVCRQLKKSVITNEIPIIFVSALGEVEDEALGFKLGSVDYITKPIHPEIVRARVRTHLALYDQNRELARKVEERTQEVLHTQDVIIHSMAVLAEIRDNETGAHIMRTQFYIKALAEKLMAREEYRDHLNPARVDLLFKSAPLHDIGKVGIADNILLKPGKLTDVEFDEMKNHTVYGRDTIIKAESAFAGKYTTSFLNLAKEIAYTHHEKWNGKGYPEGISGNNIPLSGRLMAIADVYDALISKRVYKSAFSHEKAVKIILEEKGHHFDPVIVDVFFEIQAQFKSIADKFSEEDGYF